MDANEQEKRSTRQSNKKKPSTPRRSNRNRKSKVSSDCSPRPSIEQTIPSRPHLNPDGIPQTEQIIKGKSPKIRKRGSKKQSKSPNGNTGSQKSYVDLQSEKDSGSIEEPTKECTGESNQSKPTGHVELNLPKKIPKLKSRMPSFRDLAKRVQNERSINSNLGSGEETNINQYKKKSESLSMASTFHDVASQVVNTQRAAKGFKSMWAKNSSQFDSLVGGIYLEKKKLDLRKVAAEYKEVKRSQFYHELLIYGVFLVLFFMLLRWLPVHDAFEQSNVVADLICTESGNCEFKNISDIYEFAESLNEKICPSKDDSSLHRWSRVGGLRIRQVRVKSTECPLLDSWSMTCYPSYSNLIEDIDPIVGQDKRVYIWQDGFEPLRPRLHLRIYDHFMQSNFIESYGTGGYVVDICDLDRGVDILMEDQWIGMGTRAISLEFTLVNPATKIFTIGYHVFTVSASGHIKHFPQSSNVRLVGSEEDSGIIDSRFVLWVCAIGFFFTYVRAEITEMNKMGIGSYIKTDTWNIFELTQLYVLGSVLYYISIYYWQCSDTITALKLMQTEGASFVNMQPLLITFQLLTDYASMASAISLLKVFKFLRMNSTLNLLWKVLGMAMKDLMGFLFIFNVIFFSYSSMGSFAFGFALEEFSTITSSYGTCFHMLAGDFDYDQLHQANPRVAPIFFGSFVVLVFQILVNMFVAILSEYYEVAKDNSASTEDIEYDVITRVRAFLASCSPDVVLPDNEPIVLQLGQTVRLISTNLVDKEVTRQRAKKLFRGAVWRVVALLRFGMKFDRKIGFTRKGGHKDDPNNNNLIRSSHIPLSDNFDHKTIKEMLPQGITIRLEGDSLLGTDVLLRVERHSRMSIECKVLGSAIDSSDEEPLELLGGEILRIPWQLFLLHVGKTILRELRVAVMRATKWWDPSEAQLVDDYHLGRLLNDAREDGRLSLRFDELFRIVDLFLRKDRPGYHYTQAEVRKETASVMYRFRKSLIDMPSREKEGHDYRPKPLDTSMVELGTLDFLSEMLAENCHDIWALERIKQGWVFGNERECDKKTHPNLVPYHKLPKSEQMYDYRTSTETLKTILCLKFQITRNTSLPHYLRNSQRTLSSVSNSSTSGTNVSGETVKTPTASMLRRGTGGRSSMSLRRFSSGDDYSSPYFVELDDGEIYCPRPIDTSNVELPKRLNLLVDLLAENAHEVWSKGRMDDGWTYGPARDDKFKKHPCLVPFVFLTDEEKDYDVNTAMGTLKMLLAMGFNVTDKNDSG